MTATACAQCGASFECCPQPDQRCWCLELPPLPAELLGREAQGCYCPACLRAKLSSSLSSWERAGVRASRAKDAGIHAGPPPVGEGVAPGQEHRP